MPTVPTAGESYAKLAHHLREAQDQAAILAHLANTEDGVKDKALAMGWLAVSEQLKRFVHVVTQMAMGRMQ